MPVAEAARGGGDGFAVALRGLAVAMLGVLARLRTAWPPPGMP
jgi:hypothetical protein